MKPAKIVFSFVILMLFGCSDSKKDIPVVDISPLLNEGVSMNSSGEIDLGPHKNIVKVDEEFCVINENVITDFLSTLYTHDEINRSQYQWRIRVDKNPKIIIGTTYDDSEVYYDGFKVRRMKPGSIMKIWGFVADQCFEFGW